MINTAIFLKNDHRFVDDPERFSNGTVTKEDIRIVNSQSIDGGKGNRGKVYLPKEDTSDVYYVFETNTE